MIQQMSQLNSIGEQLSSIAGVNAMTDVTGFGLLGHLIEMAEGSNLSAHIRMDAVPVINSVPEYIRLGAVPGGTNRNWQSYGQKVSEIDEQDRLILADPQTSGGLLIAVRPEAVEIVKAALQEAGIRDVHTEPIGSMTKKGAFALVVE